MTALTESKALQEKGKKAAIKFLERKGYAVLEQDWECKYGTVDLIVTDDDTLVFVEVKTRIKSYYGLPEEKEAKELRRKFEQLAIEYLSQVDTYDVVVRFDVILLSVFGKDRAFLRHHVNALSPSE